MGLAEGVKRGSVELLLLTLLNQEDMYGYQLSQELARQSNGRYTLLESSMYPTLYRLLDRELISDRRELVGKRRFRVYYHLEPQGLEYLKECRKEYLSLCCGVLDILGIDALEEVLKDESD